MTNTRSRIDHLRQRAEQVLARGTVSPAAIERVDVEDLGTLLHELQTYQAELEIQNLELHEAQQVSETATRRYRLLFGALPISVLVVDPLGMIQEANDEASRVFGLDGWDSHLRKSILRLLDADGEDNERLLAVLKNGLDPQAGKPLTLSMIPADGSRLPMEVFASPLPAAYHEDRHHLLICLDLSVRKEADELRAAKQEADRALAPLSGLNFLRKVRKKADCRFDWPRCRPPGTLGFGGADQPRRLSASPARITISAIRN